MHEPDAVPNAVEPPDGYSMRSARERELERANALLESRLGALEATLAELTARLADERTRSRSGESAAIERARLTSVFRQSPSFLAVLRGPDDVYEMVNPAYERFIGVGRHIVGRPMFEALPEMRGQGFEHHHRHVRETGESLVFRELPVTLARTAGEPLEERFIDVTYLPLIEPDGSHPAIIAHGSDVTDHVLATREVERLLARSELARAEVEATREELEAANARLQEQALELELMNQQLQEWAVDTYAQRDELRATTSELEKRIEAAETARTRTEAVLASIADPYYLLDREWRFTYVNDAAEPLLQARRETLIGRTLWEAFPGVAGSEFEGPYREAMATGRATSAEAYYAPLGTWFNVQTYPWTGGLMIHFRDIGARKTAEQERERLLSDAEVARAEAEAASSAKSEFLAVMSHELRTPLNAIDGYAELMELGIRGPITEEQRLDLARIRKSQRHLLGLINGVLNYTRVEAGAAQYHFEQVPLDEALATCEALTAPQRRAKGLAFRFDGCDPALAVRADRERLQQIVLNLLTNAMKFTEPGGRVELTCAVDEREVRVSVSDTGRGIPAHQLGRIFEPFVQLDARLTRTQEGIGLGLAISRDLARGMGGDLTAESTPGVGSRFTLALPRS